MTSLQGQEGMAPAPVSEGAGRGIQSGRAWAYRVGFLLSLLCLGFFAKQVLSMQQGLDWSSPLVLQRIPLAAVLLAGAYVFATGAWHGLLKLFGANVPRRLALAIFLTTQFGKYLPGNVAQHIGRVTFARRYGLAMKPVLLSMIAETALFFSLMTAFSFPVLLFYFKLPLWMTVACLAAAIAAVTAVAFSPNLRSKLSEVVAAMRAVTAEKLLSPVGYACASILMSGTAIISLHPTISDDPAIWLHVFSVFCAAWVAGFLTPGAPAGLGVRELILSQGLMPVIGLEGAMLVALLLRAATTLADIATFGAGLILLKTIEVDGR